MDSGSSSKSLFREKSIIFKDREQPNSEGIRVSMLSVTMSFCSVEI
jgi:hypothetical protein